MDIIEKAKELGLMIAESKEMRDLKEAEAALERDIKATELMREYKLLQIEMVRAVKENKGKAKVDSTREKLLAIQQEINGYRITKDYLEAKTAFDRFMKTINDVIIFSATGEEPCSPNKCGSCGKGCK